MSVTRNSTSTGKLEANGALIVPPPSSPPPLRLPPLPQLVLCFISKAVFWSYDGNHFLQFRNWVCFLSWSERTMFSFGFGHTQKENTRSFLPILFSFLFCFHLGGVAMSRARKNTVFFVGDQTQNCRTTKREQEETCCNLINLSFPLEQLRQDD